MLAAAPDTRTPPGAAEGTPASANNPLTTLTGKIVDAEGKPIPGAHVYLDMIHQRSWVLFSDAEGGYTVQVNPARRPPDLPLGHVFAYAPGYALNGDELKATGNVLTLSPSRTLSGTVVDSAGKPLADIPISLGDLWVHSLYYGSIPMHLLREWQPCFTAVSGADGGWTLPGLPQAGKVSITLDNDCYAYAEKEITLVAGKPAGPVQFIAHAGASVAGRVLTPQGTPAVHASVWTEDAYTRQRGEWGTTNEDGNYLLSRLTAGSYTISGRDEQHAEWIANPLNAITLAEGKQTTAPDLHLLLGAVLSGTVVDAETGKPIPAVNIRCYPGNTISPDARGDSAESTRTNGVGHFQIYLRPAQWTMLCMGAPGYPRQANAEAQTFELQSGKPVTVTVKLHKGPAAPEANLRTKAEPTPSPISPANSLMRRASRSKARISW